MSDESKESKAQKLAAARKKLKEYQSKEKREINEKDQKEQIVSSLEKLMTPSDDNFQNTTTSDSSITSSTEQNESFPIEDLKDDCLVPLPILEKTEEKFSRPELSSTFPNDYLSQNSLKTIQILISEKASLSTDLDKMRFNCKEKDLEIEEIQTQLTATKKRLEDLQTQFIEKQRTANELSSINTNLQSNFENMKKDYDDKTEHLDEIKNQLTIERTKNQEIEQKFQDKCNELELAQIRINQISDKAAFTNDDRIETLTQTQFMYEQQIRDLQAMVQQLSHDKEQSNQQYQNYVQHLNNEVSSLSEKNSELSDELSKLQDRERELVDHISSLEREIQKSISRKEILNSDLSESSFKEIIELKEKISVIENERHLLQLRIKSQEENFEQQNIELVRKQKEIEEMREIIQNMTSEQPDQTKLLASIESDKVAASRALIQNEELKNQLDILQLRIVELTNDKADLTNRLDSEEYMNREIRNNYAGLEEKVRNIDEKLHFKDEEMIRLSHENNDLMKKNLVLQQQLDRLQHYEAREYSEKYKKSENDADILNSNNENHTNSHDSLHHSTPLLHHDHDHHHDHHDHHDHPREDVAPNHIATTEAVEKLQNRFTNLMSQVADLTDEKQRLEHLVLQLQCETETIGEYIALYQTQRRILKQREYEKASQMQLLQIEKEKMREKIAMLSNLVASLGGHELSSSFNEFSDNLNLSHNDEYINQQYTNSFLPESMTGEVTSLNSQVDTDIDEVAINKKLGSNESQQILSKIQNIIKEIKENAKEMPTATYNADNLNCCSGKFEIV